MIFEHFRATRACDAAQDLSDLFNVRLQNDDVQDFEKIGTKLYYQQVIHLQKWSWKVCTSQNNKILVQLQTTFGYVRTRDYSKQRTAEQFQVEDCGKTPY